MDSVYYVNGKNVLPLIRLPNILMCATVVSLSLLFGGINIDYNMTYYGFIVLHTLAFHTHNNHVIDIADADTRHSVLSLGNI